MFIPPCRCARMHPAKLLPLVVALVAAEFQVLPQDVTTEELKRYVYDGPTDCPVEDLTKAGAEVSIHYIGTIDATSRTGAPGSEFDTSHERGKPLRFTLGKRQVIPGWDMGLMGLCKGAMATLVIPPQLAYGDQSPSEGIPGGATLNFDVELVDVKQEAPPNAVFKEVDADGDGRLNPHEVKAFFAEKSLRGGRRAPHGASLTVPKDLWEREDKNNDGYIDWHEFSGEMKSEL